MVEQTPCPVCTLYLHPGMSLADHLQTHPKEQVIKALVDLATNSLSSLPPCGRSLAAATFVIPSTLHRSQQDDPLFHNTQSQPSSMQRNGFPQFQGLPSSAADATEFINNSRESKNGYIPSSQRNVMIVNRQSTMVYQAGNHNQSIVGQQLALAPPPIQLFNISHNQGKFLTPPPAYGTAISQLRSQSNNQSNHIYSRQNQSQFDDNTPTFCGTSDQSALDYTITKNLLPRQNSRQQHQTQYGALQLSSKYNNSSSSSSSSNLLMRRSISPRCTSSTASSPRLSLSPSQSPSVLRYAESPVTAHYVERDNGDFIVQETPRHIVECVEKDDGEFSVVEKVIRSPPSVVQFHDSTVESDFASVDIQNHDEDQENDNEDERNEMIIDHESTDETERYEEENDEQQQSSKQKKTVSGLTVISNVKLNPNESLDIMENIMAASSSNNEVEVFWSGIVNPIIEKIENDERETRCFEDDNEKNEGEEETNENFAKLNQDFDYQESLKVENELEMETEEKIELGEFVSTPIDDNEITAPSPFSAASSSSSSVTTSVIRLASTPITIPSAIEVTKVSEQQKSTEEKNSLKNGNENESKAQTTTTPSKSNFVREQIKRPFRKVPRKLIVKFKNAPNSSGLSQTNDESEPKQSESEALKTQDKKSIDSETSNVENFEMTNECKLEKQFGKDNQQERSEIDGENSPSNSDKIVEPFTTSQLDETIHTEEEKEEKKVEIVVVPSIPAIQPMIVYESSLAEEPNVEDDNNERNSSNNNQKTDDKYTELSKLLDNCWKNNEENKLNVSSVRDVEYDDETEEIIGTTTTDISSDNNTCDVNSIQITETSCSNIESQSQKVNELSSSSSTSLCTASMTLNSFPSTSNFSKPSTSSSALQQQQQTELQNHHHQHPPAQSYNDYPFSFLYTNHNNVDKNRLSPIYPTELWKSGTYNSGPIFQTQTAAASTISADTNPEAVAAATGVVDFHDLEERERSSYIDLDALKKANSSDAVQYCEALNIRTDEKMPAKGEISEQESNGDIENSWSQPLVGEQPYRFFNHLENYVARESWSDEGFICPQTVVEDIKLKPLLIPPSSSGESVVTQRVSPAKKPRKPRKKNGNSTTTTNAIKKNKIFTCDHCPSTFPKLKERNLHLIVQHDYKRVNRRLIREPPPATITSAEQGEQQQQQQQLQHQLQHNQQIPYDQLLLQQQQQNLEQPDGIIPSLIPGGEDIKPDTKVQVASSLDTSQSFPRTKYDSIRAGVYRMLMNFNFTVLKEKKNVEVDESIFESKTFCCFTCKRNLISVKQFDEHLIDHPAECFTCGRKFTRWSYFSIHLKRHLGWKDFECTHCSKRFVIRSALIEHMRMHTGVSPLKCKHCGKSFKRYSNLTQHKRLCHTTRNKKKKEYVCYCGEVLPSKARFIWHREIHDTKPKCCPYCRDRFIHSNSLRRHIRLVHSEKFIYDQPAECPICNQIYAKNSLKGHMTTHSMDTQHECAICNKSFSTKWNLKIHSWVHANRTAKPFKCDMCVKAFVREIDYKNHINAHKQIKPFTCEYCGCKFIRKYNYLRHRREHHGQKKFRCELCGKQFHRHYYLIEHRRTHTGERPFLCTICGKSSTTKTNHNKHLKIHHSRDPFTSET